MKIKISAFMFFILSAVALRAQIVPPLPDNISDAECFGEPPSTAWSVKLAFTYDTVGVVQNPFVGDFDNDGYTDIFVKKVINLNNYNAFVILKGPDFQTEIKSGTMPTSISAEAIARIKWDASSDTAAIVFVETASRLLKAYDYMGNLLWTGDKPIFNPTYATIMVARGVGFADFNNDGYAEVYVGNQIFDAATGIELCNGGANNKGLVLYSNVANGLFSVAADVIGDVRLELCAGNQVYDVNITSRTNPALNTMTVAKQVTPVFNTTTLHNDGATVIADFDNDGKLEILVQTQGAAQTVNTNGYLYIWKPETQQIMVTHQLTNANSRSVPFVGDINGDDTLEIVQLTYGTSGLMRAFKITGNTLAQLWQLSHSDASGSTGVTLFDFNQDGISELVYRDETELRVINGSLKSHLTGNDTTVVYNLFSTSAYSGTTYEYATVADVDGDGQAEILTTSCFDSLSRANADAATLRVYKSGGSAWAPARKVWNQYMYNAVNINEDLTVPQYQFNPATLFPGTDGIMNTSDDVRPFNNFLQQQTTLNINGMPLWVLPDVYTDASLVQTNLTGDSLTITVKVVNQGDAPIGSPVYVSLYKKTSPQVFDGTTLIVTDSINIQLLVGDTATATIVLLNISSYLPLDSVVIRLNDKGSPSVDGFPVQPECDTTNNMAKIPVFEPLSPDTTYTLCTGGNTTPTLSYAADTVSNAAYQWQASADNINWTDIPSETNSTYTPPATILQTAGVYYYRRIRAYTDAGIFITVTDGVFTLVVEKCYLPVNPHLRGRMGG